MTDEGPIAEDTSFAGFWARLGALLLDGLLLGAIGLLLGLFFAPQFEQLGPWGRLLGFVIALAYFGTLNSKVRDGQTLGKSLLKIKVVDSQGAALSVPRAYLRFLPLGIPWALNGAQFPETVVFSFWGYLLSIVVFGVGLSIAYLYVFNRPSRQSLQDLLVGSYVVRAASNASISAKPLRRLHLVVCGGLLLLSALAPYAASVLVTTAPFAPIVKMHRELSALPWVRHVQVNSGMSTSMSPDAGQTLTTFLHISAYTRDRDIENPERARQLATLAISADPTARQVDVIQVVLVYGYDIGIASSWTSRTDTRSPYEWLAQPAGQQESMRTAGYPGQPPSVMSVWPQRAVRSDAQVHR